MEYDSKIENIRKKLIHQELIQWRENLLTGDKDLEEYIALQIKNLQLDEDNTKKMKNHIIKSSSFQSLSSLGKVNTFNQQMKSYKNLHFQKPWNKLQAPQQESKVMEYIESLRPSDKKNKSIVAEIMKFKKYPMKSKSKTSKNGIKAVNKLTKKFVEYDFEKCKIISISHVSYDKKSKKFNISLS